MLLVLCVQRRIVRELPGLQEAGIQSFVLELSTLYKLFTRPSEDASSHFPTKGIPGNNSYVY